MTALCNILRALQGAQRACATKVPLTATVVNDRYRSEITVMARIALESCKVSFVSSIKSAFCCRVTFRSLEVVSGPRRAMVEVHRLRSTCDCSVRVMI